MAIQAKTQVVVRKAVASDCGGIAELVNAFRFRSDGSGQLIPLTEEDISGLVSNGLFFIAGQNGNVIACGSVVEYEGGEMAELRSLAVRQDYQRNGLGSAIIQKCVQEARARGHGVLYTLTQPQNFALFQRAGFEKAGTPLEKHSRDCAYCPIYDSCNETAFMKRL